MYTFFSVLTCRYLITRVLNPVQNRRYKSKVEVISANKCRLINLTMRPFGGKMEERAMHVFNYTFFRIVALN